MILSYLSMLKCIFVNLKWSEVKWSEVIVSQSCLTLCDPMDLVHGILQARILEWVAFPFSRGSSQSRDRTQISHLQGWFFTSWATRKPKNTGSPSPGDLPDPGIEPGSSALQADSLPTELWGKPQWITRLLESSSGGRWGQDSGGRVCREKLLCSLAAS